MSIRPGIQPPAPVPNGRTVNQGPGQPGGKRVVDLSTTQPPARNWVPQDSQTSRLLSGFRL
jgi:hypothetical protein